MEFREITTVKARNFRSVESALKFARSIAGEETAKVSTKSRKAQVLFTSGCNSEKILDRACKAFGFEQGEIEDMTLTLVPTKSGQWSVEIEGFMAGMF